MVAFYTHFLSSILLFNLKIEGSVFLRINSYFTDYSHMFLTLFWRHPVGSGKKIQCFMHWCQGRQTFPVKGQLQLRSSAVVAGKQPWTVFKCWLWQCSVKLYVQIQAAGWIWAVGCSLLTSVAVDQSVWGLGMWQPGRPRVVLWLPPRLLQAAAPSAHPCL